MQEFEQEKLSYLRSWIAVILVSFAVYIYLTNAFTGQNLHVWGDELTYSADTRYLDFKNAIYPVYLYLSVFSLAHFSASNLLESARHLNALFIAFSLPFLYMTANSFLSRPWALVITLITAFSPITTYAAYFMPDAMFFSAFFVYAWFCLTKREINGWAYGLIVGTMAALLTLIKPHGIFLFLSTIISFIVYFLYHRNINSAKQLLKIVGLSLFAFFLIRFFITYIVDGPMNFLGAYAMWTPFDWNPEKFGKAIDFGVTLIKGHSIGIISITGPSLVAFFLPIDNKVGRQKILFLKIFVACGFLLMLLITIMFSIRIAEGAPLSDTMRLHMRYYNYFFPLIYIIFLCSLNHKKSLEKYTIFIILIMALCILSIATNNIGNYASLALDAPELRGLSKNLLIFKIYCFVVGLLLLLIFWKPSIVARIYLGLVLPSAAVIGSIYVNQDLSSRKINMLGDTAGKIVREYLGPDLKRISFFGDVTAINQAQFSAGGVGSYNYVLDQAEPLPNFGPVDPRRVTSPYNFGKTVLPRTNWIMVFGERAIPSGYSPYLTSLGWVLYKNNAGVFVGQPFNLSDTSWLNGVSRTGDAFFIENSQAAQHKFKVGQSLQFSDKKLRTVTNVSRAEPYINIFVTGPALDGQLVGYPHSIELFE